MATSPIQTFCRLALSLALATLSAACVGAAGLPPTRTDVSATMATRNGAAEHGRRISSGVHWASGTRSRKVPYDAGVGVVYERVNAAPELQEAKTADLGPAPAYRHNLGGYVEGAKRLSASGATRSWVGARAEMLRDVDSRDTTMSLTGRISWEVYSGGAGVGADSSSDGFVVYAVGGTVGVGSYVESGVRVTPSGQAEFLVSAGLSMRMPALGLMGVSFRIR